MDWQIRFWGWKAVARLNIDLTFDNILVQGEKVQIIHYELIFDFPIPIKYPMYRALYALCLKNRNQFIDFIREEEIYGTMGISQEECELFFRMNEAFMWYVEGGSESYTKMLQAYEKPALSLEMSKSLRTSSPRFSGDRKRILKKPVKIM